MTEIIRRIEEIKVKYNNDDETQHARQDDLTELVLRAIAGGAENPRKLAEEVIKVYDIGFSRWYA